MVLYGALPGGVFMAYFLKKSNLKKGTYLQIYESFYDSSKKATAHKSYKAIGYVNDLIASGIDDPIAFFSDEVASLNRQRNLLKSIEKEKKIASSPVRFLGYAPINNLLNGLNISHYLDLLQSHRRFHFNLYEVLEALIFSRCIAPCSKFKTFHEVIPFLFHDYHFSYDQMMDALAFLGHEYEKVIEIFTKRVNDRYGSDIACTYFDCTNFYFEIDKEDDFRRKGPSKENRSDPIVGLGLLLDANQIPIAMKMYPGNDSEKPVLRDIISSLKLQNHVKGKTIQVADKGLNCAANIAAARNNCDGYLFSKSVKTLSGTEQTWILLDQDYTDVNDSDHTLLYRYKSCVDVFEYRYTDEYGRKHRLRVKEKRLATFNPKLAEKKRFEIHKLIEKAKSLKAYHAKKSEYGPCAKYVNFSSIDSNGKLTDDTIAVTINEEAIYNDLKLAGYNLLITSELDMPDKQIYQIYHNLWRIEESFKIMKSELDARPAYVQKEDCIKGHFLICYLAVLLLRLFEFKIMKNTYSASQICNFIRNFKVLKETDNRYINISSSSDFIKDLSKKFSLPYTNFFLSDSQIKMMLDHVL